MHKRQKQTFAGIGALGAMALLLGGCGGNSFSKNSFGTYPNTLPYAYGLEPIAYYGAANNIGAQAFIEGSGLQDAASGQAYITSALAFTATTPVGAKLPTNADPNGTGTLPLGFSTGGHYVDLANQVGVTPASVTSVAPGASVVFRAAIANGIANNNAAGITGATLTSTDPALASVAGLTAGIPMSLNVVKGAFSNATYVTGTNGTPAPFTIPAGTTSGLHTVAVAVTDNAGRTTSTTFMFPVVASGNVVLFAQNITPDNADGTPGKTAQPITPGDTVTIDGAAGVGTYPAGYAATTADTQGTVIFFLAPGTHTLVDTTPVAATKTAPATTTVTTQTIVIAAPTPATGSTVIQ